MKIDRIRLIMELLSGDEQEVIGQRAEQGRVYAEVVTCAACGGSESTTRWVQCVEGFKAARTRCGECGGTGREVVTVCVKRRAWQKGENQDAGE